MAIQEGGNVRTTPRASPRSSVLGTRHTATQISIPGRFTPSSNALTPLPARSSPLAPTAAFNPEYSEDDDGAPTPTPSSPYTRTRKPDDRTKEKRRSNLGRPPPILKNAGSSGSSRSASVQSPVIGPSQISAESYESQTSKDSEKSLKSTSQRSSDSAESSTTPRYVSTRFSEQVAVSIPHPPTSSLGGKGERSSRSPGGVSSKSKKRDYVVHAGSFASKKRPIVMRQRSSQTSSSGNPSPNSPRIDTQPSPDDNDEGLTMTSNSAGQRAVSPRPKIEKSQTAFRVSSAEDRGSSLESYAKRTTEKNTLENTLLTKNVSPLVEPDFRTKFADRSSKQHRSFTNLPAAAWRSTAVAPTAASYQASGTLFPEQATTSGRRGSNRTAFHDEIVSLKAPAPAGPFGQDDAEETTTLPRTKSQLTLLLERTRGAGQDTKGKAPAAS